MGVGQLNLKCGWTKIWLTRSTGSSVMTCNVDEWIVEFHMYEWLK